MKKRFLVNQQICCRFPSHFLLCDAMTMFFWNFSTHFGIVLKNAYFVNPFGFFLVHPYFTILFPERFFSVLVGVEFCTPFFTRSREDLTVSGSNDIRFFVMDCISISPKSWRTSLSYWKSLPFSERLDSQSYPGYPAICFVHQLVFNRIVLYAFTIANVFFFLDFHSLQFTDSTWQKSSCIDTTCILYYEKLLKWYFFP